MKPGDTLRFCCGDCRLKVHVTVQDGMVVCTPSRKLCCSECVEQFKFLIQWDEDYATEH